MKRWIASVLVGMTGIAVAGCPMYGNGDEEWCTDPSTCVPGHDCPRFPCGHGRTYYGTGGYWATGGHGGGTLPTDASVDVCVGDTCATDGGTADGSAKDATLDRETAAGSFCGNPDDCAAGSVCAADGTCHEGTCDQIPCINGYSCSATLTGSACVRPGRCQRDEQCKSGDACVDGVCTPASELCSDRGQCEKGSVCAGGRCTPACTSDQDCVSSGHKCRTALGICSLPLEECDTTADCGDASKVCFAGACMPRCSVQGPCGTEGVCVDSACIAEQKRTSACSTEGSTQGCGEGQVCLHGACYVSCASDAGACAGSGLTCKVVTAGDVSLGVCGAADTLGTECDPTRELPCDSGSICIDGTCR